MTLVKIRLLHFMGKVEYRHAGTATWEKVSRRKSLLKVWQQE